MEPKGPDSPCDDWCQTFTDAEDHDRYHDWERYWNSLTPTERRAEEREMLLYTMETLDDR